MRDGGGHPEVMPYGTAETEVTDLHVRPVSRMSPHSVPSSIVHIPTGAVDRHVSLSIWLIRTGGEARARHALAQTALFEKVLLEPVQLTIEKVVGLVN